MYDCMDQRIVVCKERSGDSFLEILPQDLGRVVSRLNARQIKHVIDCSTACDDDGNPLSVGLTFGGGTSAETIQAALDV